MKLELTVVAGLGVEPFPPAEFTAVWPAAEQGRSCSGDSLRQALDQRWPACSFSVGCEALEGLRAGAAPLLNGAVVVVQRSPTLVSRGAGVTRSQSSGLYEGVAAFLCICSGPGAGTVFALQRGRYTLGRGHCRLTLADPALSRHHGTLCVSSREITLTSAPSSSGFTVQPSGSSPTASAETLKGTEALTIGRRVRCGSTVFELRLPDSGFLPEVAGSGGAPLLTAAVLEPLVVAQEANPARNRVAMIVSGTLPLLLGVGLALLMRSWMFLAFSAMGAIAVVIPLVGGSKRRKAFRAAVDCAVAHDWERRAAAFPDAAALLLATRSGAQEQSRGQPRAGPLPELAVRLGVADQRAAVTVSPMDATFTAPEVIGLPLTVLLGPGPVTISGPSTSVARLLSFVLMQLDAAHIPVVVCGPLGGLPLEARFLPHTVLVCSPAAAATALAAHRQEVDGAPEAVLVSVNEPVTELLGTMPGIAALCFTTPLSDTATVTLRAVGDELRGSYQGHDFVPDGVLPTVFGDYARRRSAQSGTTGDSPTQGLRANSLPLPDHGTVSAIVQDWAQTAGGPLAPIRVGLSATGPALFDFLRDGPHLLVGGTTGAGKSEFLRTLVGSLAAAHSPADLQFVFIDFKGGAGLGALTKLPHTSSLITDLGGHGMNRTLASLRAELRRREGALAGVEAADCQSYRARLREAGTPQGTHTMAHLLIVVDEFRVLVDQFPDAMNELMRIAAVGRSLGIHLVLATQRPQGAVNADIRANVTSSICLRVQSTFDSTDVIGTGIAATIAVDTPGRAFISRAGAAPEEFQSATLRLPSTGAEVTPTLELVSERLSRNPDADTGAGCDASDVAAVSALLSAAWRTYAAGGQRHCAPSVIAPELPIGAELTAFVHADATASVHDGECAEAGVAVGVADVPQQQALKTLRWHPAKHSHLALFGTPRESSNAIALLVQQLLSANDAPGTHNPFLVYLLDGNGSLTASSRSEYVGAYITPADLRTAARLLQRLMETARSHPERGFVLCCSEWGRWLTALRSSPWHEAEDALTDVIRFGQSNLVVVIGGARELVTAPFLSAIPNRVYLTHGSSIESTVLWPRLPEFEPVSGRAAIAGPIISSATSGTTHADELLIAQLNTPLSSSDTTKLTLSLVPGLHSDEILHVTPLPRSITMSQLRSGLYRTSQPPAGLKHELTTAQRISLVLGLGGDGNQLIEIRLEPGTVLPIVGSPGCGKSSLLRLLAQLNEATESAQLIYLDDAGTLPPSRLQDATHRLAQGAVLVPAFSYPGPGLAALPHEWGLRAPQQGIVLAPQRPGDADLFGVRLDTMGAEPVGRGVLLDRGSRIWFQFPHVEDQG